MNFYIWKQEKLVRSWGGGGESGKLKGPNFIKMDQNRLSQVKRYNLLTCNNLGSVS